MCRALNSYSIDLIMNCDLKPNAETQKKVNFKTVVNQHRAFHLIEANKHASFCGSIIRSCDNLVDKQEKCTDVI